MGLLLLIKLMRKESMNHPMVNYVRTEESGRGGGGGGWLCVETCISLQESMLRSKTMT